MTLGFGYGTCTTAEATVAKVATLASYALVKNGIVSIKFTYAVPANATLNINKRGAKAIYYRGTKITANVIDKGDIATFVYDGANYQLLTVDSNNPSTRIDLTGKTVDLNDLTLAAGVSHIKKYIEKTSGGAANITNIPVAGQPFILDVELIRWASTADYVSKQTFISIGDKYIEYIRYCNSGIWENWVKQVFTDSNVNQTLTTDNASYPLLLAPSGQTATANASAYFGTGITFNPSTKTLSTTTFSGALSGNASTATALTTSAGSATQPVYFSGGKPVACTYPLNLMKGATSSAAGTNGLVPAPAAGSQDKFLRGDGTWQVPPTSTITIDTSLSSTSINPVQNKVINTALANKANSSHTHTVSDIIGLSIENNIELITSFSGSSNISIYTTGYSGIFILPTSKGAVSYSSKTTYAPCYLASRSFPYSSNTLYYLIPTFQESGGTVSISYSHFQIQGDANNTSHFYISGDGSTTYYLYGLK